MNTPTTDTVEDDKGPIRRHFVAIATSTYSDAVNYPPLPVESEVAVLRSWLVDERTLVGRSFKEPFPHLAQTPDEDAIRAALKVNNPWRSADAAVVFITGHGEVRNNAHWLVLNRSRRDDLPATALRTADLLGWLHRKDGVGHLLLIVDACFAGKIAEATVQFDDPLPETWLILPSTTKGDTAQVRALTDAIAAAVRNLQGLAGQELGGQAPYFQVSDFIDQVKSNLPGQQLVPIYTGKYNARHYCLPNPHFSGPQVVDTAHQRRDLAIPVRDLRVHWQPRALGSGDADRDDAPETAGPRWLFTGRAALMHELITTARGDRDDTALVTVITGGAGCGKSAVLARLVTLSDPTFVERYPTEVAAIPDDLKPIPLHGVDVAIVATSKYPEDILRQLADDLVVTMPAAEPGVPEREHVLTALMAALAERKQPVTVVLDALDEARDPQGIVQILGRLATSERLRLLVGVRSPAGPEDPLAAATTEGSLADAVVAALKARRLQVDADPWWHQDDVRRYAESILLHTPGSLYADAAQHDQAGALARVISERVGRTFLVTRLTAEALAARPDRVDPTDPAWRATLDGGVVGAFLADLEQTYDDPAQRLRALHLLRAVAFAYGRGVPWRDGIWAAMANAVADQPHEYGSQDIADLLNSRMGAYLVTDVEDDITVYRLFHDALRGTLREQWQELLDPA